VARRAAPVAASPGKRGKIATELFQMGYRNSKQVPFSPSSIKAMLESTPHRLAAQAATSGCRPGGAIHLPVSQLNHPLIA